MLPVTEFKAGYAKLWKLDHEDQLCDDRCYSRWRVHRKAANPRCSIPDVCIDERRLPLFIARATLRDLIAGLEARATGDAAR